jgi:hypothetical protein
MVLGERAVVSIAKRIRKEEPDPGREAIEKAIRPWGMRIEWERE